jgi:hypothetical protein
VRDTLDAIKTRDGVMGEQMNSAAMSREYMDLIMAWSYLECPDICVENILQAIISGESNIKDVAKVIKHLFMHCFLSSGWTLWTR